MKNERNIIILSVLLAVVIILAVGVTYAFFNYTRTGTINTISVGRIYFHTNQNNTINLTNVFPVSSNTVINNSNNTVTVSIEGDTTYTGGIEYLVTIDDVNNVINGKEVPISFKATQSNLGTSSNTYWQSRGGNAPIYELTGEGIADNGKYVMVGYIPAGSTGVDGSVSITAYLDTTKVAITDTIENGNIAVPGYDNGTDTNWINGRVAITADEWNSFATTPLSFKVKVEANEGIWVEKEGTIASCPDCKFVFSDSNLMYTTWNTKGEEPTILTTGYSEDYRDVIESTGKNYFLGLITNGSNQVTRAFTCGVYNNVPFCVEGDANGSKYNENLALLQGPNLYNNTCASSAGYAQCGPFNNTTIGAMIMSIGVSLVGPHGGLNCNVTNEGVVGCTYGEG